MAALARAAALLLIGAVAALALWQGGVLREQVADSGGAVPAALPWRSPSVAEDTAFERLGGGELRLADYRGRVLLLNFWASWCPPCLKEFPLLLELVRELDGQLVLIAISHDSERADITAFLDRLRPEHSAVLDSEAVQLGWDPTLETSQQRFNVVYLPETFVIGPELEIGAKWWGPSRGRMWLGWWSTCGGWGREGSLLKSAFCLYISQLLP